MKMAIQFDFEAKEMTLCYGEFLIIVRKIDEVFSANWYTIKTGKLYKTENRSNLRAICSWLNSLGGFGDADKVVNETGVSFLYYMAGV